MSIILVLYLIELGFSEARIGLLLTLTLVGDTLISLWISTHADRIGRRKMLCIGAALMVLSGAVFLATDHFVVLLLAATIGILSPSGHEVGPFLALEQASLATLVSTRERTQTFAWYNLVGSLATAVGAFAGGWIADALQRRGFTRVASHRVILAVYSAAGVGLLLAFLRLSRAVEPTQTSKTGTLGLRRQFLGLHRSRKPVLQLSSLFVVDAFAGGLIVQSLLAYWLVRRFGASELVVGSVFLGSNVLSGISALFASAIARRFGLLNTMVFTHLPSNVLLLFVPWMPTMSLAVSLYLLRSCISQMDVPTRQSYTMAIVAPEERAAAAGLTGVARTLGSSASPLLCGWFLERSLLAAPFLVSGALKIVYDLLLLLKFRKLRPPEERPE